MVQEVAASCQPMRLINRTVVMVKPVEHVVIIRNIIVAF